MESIGDPSGSNLFQTHAHTNGHRIKTKSWTFKSDLYGRRSLGWSGRGRKKGEVRYLINSLDTGLHSLMNNVLMYQCKQWNVLRSIKKNDAYA